MKSALNPVREVPGSAAPQHNRSILLTKKSGCKNENTRNTHALRDYASGAVKQSTSFLATPTAALSSDRLSPWC